MARVDTLGNFLSDVADAIRTKTGDSSPIQASNFDTAIENIPSGGSVTPQSLNELATMWKDLVDAFNNYTKAIPNSYSASTSESVALYTPSADYKYYIVQKRSSGKYRVVWFKTPCVTVNPNTTGIYEAIATAGIVSETYTGKFMSQYPTMSAIETNQYFKNETAPYCSSEYDTPEECIQKMKNNELTYSRVYVWLGYAPDTPRIFPYTNMTISIGVSIPLQYFDTSQMKISSNETFITMS